MTNDAIMTRLRQYAMVSADDTQGVETLTLCLAAATGYLQGAGVTDMTGDLAQLTLCKLAMFYFDQRAPDPRYGYMPPPPDLNALILTLRHTPAEGGGAQ